MPDHFSLKLRIRSVVMFPVGLLLIFELQSNLFYFMTPASFHQHVYHKDNKISRLTMAADSATEPISRQTRQKMGKRKKI